jgi:hypothetical protein
MPFAPDSAGCFSIEAPLFSKAFFSGQIGGAKVPMQTTIMSRERPSGVTAVAALCLVVALAALALAVLLAAHAVPLSSGAFLVGGGLEQLGPIAFLVYAAIMIALAVALWKRLRWARPIAIAIAVLGIAMSVPGLSSAVMDSRIFAIGREGLQVMIRVVVVFYLSQEPVKDWFAAN